jgi:hypothetical protein
VSTFVSEDRLSDLYQQTGPFVTAYLDATRSTESGEHEVSLRWRDVRRGLRQAGADEATLAALDEQVAADVGSPGRHGQVLVGANGTVCFGDLLHRPPAASHGSFAPLPHLMPYLAQRATDLPHVVVVTDRTGADVLSVRADGDTTHRTVDGQARYPVHRTATADWSERHFQLRVENSWQTNARDVAAAAARVVNEAAARLVVVAGDVRARHMVADELRSALPPAMSVAVIDEGGRAAGSSVAALEAAVHEQVLRVAWRERREVLEHLQQNLGPREYAVAGVADVTEALRMAQADTVVVSDDPSSTLRAWVGPTPTEFGLVGSEDTATEQPLGNDRYDAALVRAVAATGARLLVTPGAHEYLPDGIGALLRYETGRAD